MEVVVLMKLYTESMRARFVHTMDTHITVSNQPESGVF